MADWMMSKSSEDFEEGDVWGVVEERQNSSPKMIMRKLNSDNKQQDHFNSSAAASSSSAWRLPSARRNIPMSSRANANEAADVVQKSAPMDIPDWSKIYGKQSAKIGSWVPDNDDDDDHGYGDVDEDDDGDDEMVPPHEWVARKLARSQISSFSVCEGIGRTLKGRDLSKVRNAILTKTGFLE